MQKYLMETPMLDYASKVIQELILKRKWKNLDEFHRIQAIYHYVRDESCLGIPPTTGFPPPRFQQMDMGSATQRELYSWHSCVR